MKNKLAPFFCYADRPIPPSPGVRIVLGYPKTLSVHRFTFPFAHPGRVKDALRFQFVPFLGENIDNAVIVSMAEDKKGSAMSGSAFVIMKDEMAWLEDDTRFWPAPLAALCDINEGVIMVSSGECISSMVVRDGFPIGYAWSPHGGIAQERERLEKWAGTFGVEGSTLIYDLENDNFARDDLREAAARTFESKPYLLNFDLSPVGSALAESRGQSVMLVTRAARALCATGVLFCVISLGLWYGDFHSASEARSAAARVYKAATGKEPADDPLNEMRGLVRRSRTEAVVGGQMFSGTLTMIAKAMGEDKESITVETLRYGADRTEITGSAKTAELAQNMAARLDAGPVAASLGDLQQIPGGGFRFVITIKGEEK